MGLEILIIGRAHAGSKFKGEVTKKEEVGRFLGEVSVLFLLLTCIQCNAPLKIH